MKTVIRRIRFLYGLPNFLESLNHASLTKILAHLPMERQYIRWEQIDEGLVQLHYMWMNCRYASFSAYIDER